MKALSGYAEWFWLMAKGWKDIENRPKPLPRAMAMELPVRIYLHASKSDHVQHKASDDLDVIVANLTPGQLGEFCAVDWDRLRGHIIGEVTIVKQMRKVRYTESDHIDIGSQQKELQIYKRIHEPASSPWFFGPFGYVVKYGILYNKPIPCRGMLGFFEPDIAQNACSDQSRSR